MSLTFGAATSDRVNCGSASVLDDLTVASFLAWIYPTTLSNARCVMGKQTGGAGLQLTVRASGAIDLNWVRSTGSLFSRSSSLLLTTNKWWFVACVANQTGTVRKLYVGDLATAAAEPTYDAASADGSGTYPSDAANNLTIGNVAAASPTLAFQGRIAVAAVINRQLTLGEVVNFQFNPRALANCLGLWHLGYNGTGTQPDYSGNGNNGTVTGATQSEHAPLRPVFGSRAAGWRGAFLRHLSLSASAGSFALTGQAGGLTAQRRLTADVGTFVLTGRDANLLAQRLISAGLGVFVLTGQNAGLRAQRLLAAAAGSFVLTGRDAALVFGSPSGATLAAATGAFLLTGQAASLLAARLLTASAGSFVLTGQDAALTAAGFSVSPRLREPGSLSALLAPSARERQRSPARDTSRDPGVN